tara:strand:- start:170 stop:760 length:591 start_codon:yes stop_codon:yes gene_type:complete
MFTRIFRYLWPDDTGTNITNKSNMVGVEVYNAPISANIINDEIINAATITDTIVKNEEDVIKLQQLVNLNNKTYKGVVYELNVNWYSNFIGYSNKIISNTYSILNYDEDEILDEYFSLYNKLSNQYRLIDYMFRTRKGMFSDNIVTRSKLKCHINSLVIRKGYIYDNNSVNYETNICESVYNFSIIVDNENNWEII